MKEHVHDMELIERFLDGQLTDDEKEKFDEKRQTDREFNALLVDMDMLIEGVKQSAEKTGKEEKLERMKFFADVLDMEIRAAEDDHRGVAGKVIPLYRKPSLLAAAASVALLVALGAYLTRDKLPLNERLYAVYFEPFDSPGAGLTRGNNNEEMTPKARAYDAYDNERYAEAVNLFNDILKKTDDPIMHLCMGNAQLKLGEFVKAESTFTHMLAEHDDLVTQTKWYLALTYLKENKMERAKATLWEISKSSTYGEKALKVLSELE